MRRRVDGAPVTEQTVPDLRRLADCHRTLAGQVMSAGVPVVSMHLEGTLDGKRRVFAWSAYRVTDNGRVLGAVDSLTDITGPVQASAALRQANAPTPSAIRAHSLRRDRLSYAVTGRSLIAAA